MKLKIWLSISAIVVIAIVVLGSAVYVSAHPNVYPKEERGAGHFDRRG